MQRSPISVDAASDDLFNIVKSIEGVIPVATNPAEDAFYGFVREFIHRTNDKYWTRFLSLLLLIFVNKEKWELASPDAWTEGGLHVFAKSNQAIADIIIEDIKEAPEHFISRTTSTTSLTKDGMPLRDTDQFIRPGSWRKEVLQTAQDIVDNHNNDPDGYESGLSPPKNRTSIVGYILSPEGLRNLTDNTYPEYFKSEPGFMWSGMTEDREKMEIFLTATHEGHITLPHEDGPGLDSMVWHLFGVKLWLMWEGSPENQQVLLDKRGYSIVDLQWCLDHLIGLKVYFFHPLAKRGRLLHPGGAIHFVMSFTPCMALSSSYFRRSRLEISIQKTRIMQESLSIFGVWTHPDEWDAALYRVKRSRQGWTNYLRIQDTEIVGDLSADFILDTLGPLPTKKPTAQKRQGQ